MAVASLEAHSSQSCEHWNTAEFFRTASVEDVAACLAAGADLEAATDASKFTPLHLVARDNENPAVLDALLATGADVLATDNQGWTPLHSASGNHGSAVINAFLSAGADPPARTSGIFAGLTPPHTAAWSNENLAVLRMLMAVGADPMARTENGRTPLHFAAASNSGTVVEALLADGAAVEVRDEVGITPLWRIHLSGVPVQTCYFYGRFSGGCAELGGCRQRLRGAGFSPDTRSTPAQLDTPEESI